MTTRFKSTYRDSDAFYLRADLLCPMFGHWDSEDPVSHAILDVVEAQRELSDAISDDVERGVGGEPRSRQRSRSATPPARNSWRRWKTGKAGPSPGWARLDDLMNRKAIEHRSVRSGHRGCRRQHKERELPLWPTKQNAARSSNATSRSPTSSAWPTASSRAITIPPDMAG